MILLSEDGKTLIKIESWDDIIQRPGFSEKIDPKQVKLKQIIGRYNIDPKQPCGISSCGTAHNMGYLVVCEGGIETNIGNKCGKRIFGVDFQALEKTFTKDTNAQRYRESIGEFKNRIGSYSEKIKYIKEGDKQGQWCYDKMHWQITKGFEQATVDRLMERSRVRNNTITQETALDKREIEIAREMNSNGTYKTTQIAIISGISAVTSYRKIKTILNVNLYDEINKFIVLDQNDIDFEDLKFWNSWVNRFEIRLRELEEIIRECIRFLQPTNLDIIRTYKRLL